MKTSSMIKHLCVAFVFLSKNCIAISDEIEDIEDEPNYDNLKTAIPLDLPDKVVFRKKVNTYNPSKENKYLLFTRRNPHIGHAISPKSADSIKRSHYSRRKKTIILFHDWHEGPNDMFNFITTDAILGTEDSNVIVVDWQRGTRGFNFEAASKNTLLSGLEVAEVLDWVLSKTETLSHRVHLVGHGLGAHQAGIVGRNMKSKPFYITGLDPSRPNWIDNNDRLKHSDASYVEVIHTNADKVGFSSALGHVDFFPNGGANMPGCAKMDVQCSHDRSYQYFAESVSDGGFIGKKCRFDRTNKYSEHCNNKHTLRMGGLTSKRGSAGIYFLTTNARPPFSKQ